MTRLLRELAFENRYQLHPRRFEPIADAAVTALLKYLTDFDAAAARESGRALAREGVGVRPLQATGAALRALVLEAAGVAASRILDVVDGYFHEAFAGYVDELLERTLQNQEEIRRALSAALTQQSRELLIKNHAIDTSLHGILLTDMDGRVTYANPAFVALWGFTRAGEVVGTVIGDLVGQYRNLDLRDPAARLFQGELVVRRRSGDEFDAEAVSSLILDDRGRPVGLMASFADVTERKRMETQIRQAQKMDALGQLAGGIVHDFNNLLAAIGGYAQLLLLDVPEDSEHYEDFRQIKAATDRAKDLTDQLRFFSRQVSARRVPLNLNGVVHETERMLLRTFPREIIIRQDLQEDLWSIAADASQVSQLLVNLCLNARDAILARGEEGGVIAIATRRVTLSRAEASRFVNAQAGHYVCLRVADNGIGMTNEVRDRIFEPFFTTKENSGGTGLGLALVYGIVRHHDGFLEVTSAPGQGATFELYFPALEQAAAEEAGEQPDGFVRGSGTVLVVDDEPQVLSMITRFLGRCGYRTVTAANGLEAIEAFRERHPEIVAVVLDMVMPRMGGRKCLAALREIDPQAKVVCVSGFTADDSFRDLEREGSFAALEKPLDLRRFSEIIAAAVRSRSS